MQELTAARRLIVVGCAIAMSATFAGTEAVARDGKNKGTGASSSLEGGAQNNQLYSRAAVVSYDRSQNGGGGGGGNLQVSGGDWTPPGCWLAPKWTPKQLKKKTEKYFRDNMNDPEQANYAKRAIGEGRDYFRDGKYKNYNLKKQGDGMFWGPVENENYPANDERRTACDRRAFWVPEGEQPDVPNAIDPEILAGLAYQQIEVPDTEVELSPENKQTVHLPTWAWLDKGKFKPVSVSASVDLGGGQAISATTTAKPVALKLQPGTGDATLHPASGECPINDNGSIGTPYTKGDAKKTPPCGITYNRATSKGGTFPLKATVTWEVSWKGTGGTGDELPDGEFGGGQDVTVQEVQSIVR